MTSATARLVELNGEPVVEVELEAGQHAFVDADALAAGSGPVDHLVVEADSVEEAAVAAAASAAGVVAEIVAHLADRSVHVVGDGIVAALVRQRVVDTGPGADAVVLTRVSREALLHALSVTPELGLLVLAAAVPPTTVDVYGGIHRAGITVAGVPPFGRRRLAVDPPAAAPAAAPAHPGRPFPRAKHWYHLRPER